MPGATADTLGPGALSTVDAGLAGLDTVDQEKPGADMATPAVADGGATPKDHDGWMWDLPVPGNDDHDFYVSVAATAVLVHNDSCPSIAARLRAAGPGDEFGLPSQGRIRYVPPQVSAKSVHTAYSRWSATSKPGRRSSAGPTA